ncbi:FAD binding domain-containing protein [Suillus paluster]|uniref:FAD binding domain-containing protein n=1 Tax=Suillus paluster TaxID=48578 RepID=UPI001B877208|nr:FAD binding domain-containing protein [Suillus paluster]KAG1745463.1 FAD binding domain-containing protein [Suillus paluster]
MNSADHPVLVVGAGPAGLVAALTLVQNGIPVRIIDKDPNPRIGQRGPTIWPRSLELFNFLNVPEVNNLGKQIPVIRLYKPGTLEPLKDYPLAPHMEPTPAVPFHIPKMIGQQLLDVVLRRHLEKFYCSVEMNTELSSFKQSEEGIAATFDTKWMIGADGAKGVVRKQLGLTFLGETRDDFCIITGDIRLKGVGLDRVFLLSRLGDVFTIHRLMLRPTDEIGEDGWHFFISDRELELMKTIQSEELIFASIASFIPTEITFNKLVWRVDPFVAGAISVLVNKFGEDRVFVMGGVWFYLGVCSCADGSRRCCTGLNSGVQDAKLALVEKGLADKSLLKTYSAERLPVISEMIEMTTSILNQTLITGELRLHNPTVFMLGVNCRFSSIVLDEFATPIEGKPVNAYGVFDEGHLEAGDRAPDAPNVLQVGRGESDVKTLFGLYKPWCHTVLVFAPSLSDATSILGALEAFDRRVVRKAVVLPSSTPVAPVVSPCADVVLIDEGGYAYTAYFVEANQTKVFVIRPDGVIGAIVHGEEGVQKYFSNIFLDL